MVGVCRLGAAGCGRLVGRRGGRGDILDVGDRRRAVRRTPAGRRRARWWCRARRRRRGRRRPRPMLVAAPIERAPAMTGAATAVPPATASTACGMAGISSAAIDGRRLRELGEQGAAGDAAEQQRQHDHGEVGADLVDLLRDDRALGAVLEVVGHALRVAGAQPVAGVVAEVRHRPLAFTGCGGVADVGLQPGLAQAFASAVRERGDAVGGDAHDGRDLVRVHALDLGVPEHRLPALGQAAERARRQGAVECPCGRVVRDPLVFEVFDHVHLDVARRGSPGAREIADRRIEVGAEGPGGTAARQYTLEDPRIGLRNEVIRIDRGELTGDASGGAVVTEPKLPESARIPRSSAFDQFRVRSGRLRVRTAHPPDPFWASLCPYE